MVIIECGFGYSLRDMCEIANFDFFSNPFIPGQRLDYYTKFLKPLHDVLASYKKVWTNSLKAKRNNNFKRITRIQLPTKIVDDTQYVLDGPEMIDYLGDLNNWINTLKDEQGTVGDNNNALGFQFNFQYINRLLE